MAQDVERVRVGGVARGQDLDLLPVGERQPQVLHGAVRAQKHGLLGQLRADRAGGIEAGRAVGKFQLRPSGRTTFMDEEDTQHPREDDRNEELDDSPVPDSDGEHTEDEDTAPI